MSEACPNEESTMESEWQEGLEEEQDMDPETEKYTYKLVLPEDGYEWKKYGQKFIKNIGKFRRKLTRQFIIIIIKRQPI
ncbi:hypothetical protein L484_005079 [Morus notabilis]|uniref:WRKY domain-containing protein n=1 Tax=Morus notabilis TaxID=981085 RepID=W9S9B6_9ROSA|nr:hypothetical protein L484_005079 [Morus notabilis]